MKTTVRSSVSTPDPSTLREALYTLAIKRLQQAQGFLAHDPSARQDEARTAINEALELIDQAEATRRPKRADLTHNISDLKPGSLRDKYALSLYILESV